MMIPKLLGSLIVVNALLLSMPMAGDAKAVTLKVMFKDDPEDVRASKARIKAFQEKFPNIKVVPEYNSGGQTPNQKLIVQLAGGAAPDLAVIDLEPVELALRGLLLPLDSFIKGDKDFSAKQWVHKRQIDEFKVNGKLYALPEGLCPYTFYYNADLFRQVGLPMPPNSIKGQDFENWTYDKFVEVGKRLTRDTNGDGKPDSWGFQGWGFSHPDGYTPWIWMNGGDLFKTNPKTSLASASSLSDPKVVDAIQWYCDLKNKQKVIGGDFLTGKVGFSYAGVWKVPSYKNAKLKFEWDIAPLPHPSGQETNHLALLRPRGAILSSTKHPNEAWQFLRFVSEPEQEELIWDAGAVQTIPVYRNSVIMDRFLKQSPPKSTKLFMEVASSDSSRCSWDNKVPRRWGEIWAAMGSELSKVWDNKATAAQICGPLEKKINVIMNR